ncbi:hypothetical protein LEP1GSC024_4670 [Leptospira noguchii str. 2001034031]|uniref:Uncharacterized protein n=2 Tax=Leptospira noguchii TaxID=28182 RepID=M6Y981_9LEPT|nr:hypothetical protein LEP1GSC072_3599 [Leptospira noguchii str. Bonito]EMO90300.1 hypothetical protein LEP1GSC024_4670 [Leptospira noguchii str. 2001034031]
MPAKQQFHTEIESDDSLEIYHSNYIMVGLFRNLECRLPSKKPIMKKFISKVIHFATNFLKYVYFL